jgi:hypothetical protein
MRIWYNVIPTEKYIDDCRGSATMPTPHIWGIPSGMCPTAKELPHENHMMQTKKLWDVNMKAQTLPMLPDLQNLKKWH